VVLKSKAGVAAVVDEFDDMAMCWRHRASDTRTLVPGEWIGRDVLITEREWEKKKQRREAKKQGRTET
jgi:hypothetical protein